MATFVKLLGTRNHFFTRLLILCSIASKWVIAVSYTVKGYMIPGMRPYCKHHSFSLIAIDTCQWNQARPSLICFAVPFALLVSFKSSEGKFQYQYNLCLYMTHNRDTQWWRYVHLQAKSVHFLHIFVKNITFLQIPPYQYHQCLKYA